jgi:hypothetical protein
LAYCDLNLLDGYSETAGIGAHFFAAGEIGGDVMGEKLTWWARQDSRTRILILRLSIVYCPIAIFTAVFLYYGIRAKLDLIEVIPMRVCILFIFGSLGWMHLLNLVGHLSGRKGKIS